MGKYLLGLVGAGVLAFMVKTYADDAGRKLAAVRETKAPAAAPAKIVEPGVLVSFEDPLGCYRVMAPGEPGHLTADSAWLHGIGRGASTQTADKAVRLEVRADFVGSDGLNSPGQSLRWITKKSLGRVSREKEFDRAKFSRDPAGGEVADFEYEWRGNNPHAHRSRLVLYRKWLYTLTAHGVPDGLDTPDVQAFFDTFALTDKALDHPDGGVLKP